MYYINKIVGFVSNPLVIALVGGFAAMLCVRLKRTRAAKCLFAGSTIWLWLWATPIMTWIVGTPLEREFLDDGRVPLVEKFQAAEAIALLGGGIGAPTNLSEYAEMAAGADRVWQAARLFKAEKALKIIATGFCPKESTLPLLNDFGVPEDCVYCLYAENTEQEAKALAKLGYKKIFLVTSAWHMKRARLMFRKYAPEIEVICAPADFEMSIKIEDMLSFGIVLPDIDVLHHNSIAIHEWIGIIGYKLFR